MPQLASPAEVAGHMHARFASVNPKITTKPMIIGSVGARRSILFRGRCEADFAACAMRQNARQKVIGFNVYMWVKKAASRVPEF
ncbi:hypothetical protein [Ensifer aridi]|uniref:hypothetical protein n=1 Tax=Ensifer aridi TaxID=1708715 RepID=UPI000A120B30|nr:hypothetical protein [Ensifer aridi]